MQHMQTEGLIKHQPFAFF